MDVNKLSLNLEKTKVMFFGHYTDSSDVVINVNSVVTDKVSENKFLSITTDSKLSWKFHIRCTESKVSKGVSIINKAKYLLDYNALYLLYCSLVLPYFIDVWGNNYRHLLNPLFILQKWVLDEYIK